MSNVLQVALFIASVVFTILVLCLIPIVFEAKRKLNQLVDTTDALKDKAQDLVRDSHEMVRKLTEVTNRVNDQLEEFHHVLHTIREWTDRTDSIVKEVEDAIEPPVHALARNMSILRLGIGAFAKAFLRRYQHKSTNEE